jgi:hypothetical protein
VQSVLLYAADGIYLAARTAGMILKNYGAAQMANGTLFRQYARNMRFVGQSGTLVLDGVSERQPSASVNIANKDGTLTQAYSAWPPLSYFVPFVTVEQSLYQGGHTLGSGGYQRI